MVMAAVYTQAGEIEKAIDEMEEGLSVPGYFSPNWIRIDPLFDPLRGNLRFEQLLERDVRFDL
jgi:hypothetical protein